MKRILTFGALLGWLVMFLLATNTIEAIVMFLLFGIVPWSSTSLNAQTMLALYYLLAAGIFLRACQPQIKAFFRHQKSATRRQSQA